jgi:alpha-L-fucosidase
MKALFGNSLLGLALLAGVLGAPRSAMAQTRPAATFSNASPILFREGGAGLPPYPVVVRDETPGEQAARMQWFREARFGMFIHWGVYAVPARGEWYMNNGKVPVATYKAYARDFTAAKYDPQAWAALAKEAGMKYVVLTAKHHDGFALYNSAVSDWNAVKSSAAGRDLIQPIADAARAQGMTFGLYYSQSQDWINLGGGTGRDEPWDEEQKKGSLDDYLAKIALPQMREILDKYNPAYLFFDTEYSMTPERARPIFDLTCQYPDLIINNRLGGGVLGDTGTPEQRIATDPLGRAFEVCMTINGSWGYNTNDMRYKSAQQLIRNLSDITSKGGNYLLNVGPTAEGLIPQPQVERLQAIGKWMRTNGEAIYGTEAGPFSISTPPTWGRATQKLKPGGDTTLYVHIWNWPADGKLVLSGVQQAARSARMLAGEASVHFVPSPEGLVLTLPGTAPDQDVSVVALEFAHPVRVARRSARSTQSEASGTPLDPRGGTP